MAEARRFPVGRTAFLGRRGGVLVVVGALALVAYLMLGLRPAELVPTQGGARVAREFFAAAWQPALDWESSVVPSGSGSFLGRVAQAVVRTLCFAAASMSLALVLGTALGFLASSSWWRPDEHTGGWRRALGPGLQVATRLLIACLRSVHELLWAVVLLAAFGLNSGAAVVALALPFSGVLAKVFSELLDEAPPESARALRAAGARPVPVFLVGTATRALPDMAAYAFYRFECAVRASAVLGFFGYETLGHYLKLSFESLYYREVWTYLYALLALVLVLEAWSAALRRRFVA